MWDGLIHCVKHLAGLAGCHLMTPWDTSKNSAIEPKKIDARWSIGHHSELDALKSEMGHYSGTGRWVVLVAPPYRLPGSMFKQVGIDPARCMVIQVRSIEARLCAVQQALSDRNVGMVIFWSGPLAEYSTRQLESRVEVEGISCIHFRTESHHLESTVSLPIAA